MKEKGCPLVEDDQMVKGKKPQKLAILWFSWGIFGSKRPRWEFR